MRTVPTIAVLTALLAAGAPPAAAGSDGAGTTAAQFLELPVGARAIAMGAAAGAVAADATALYYNPAGLAGIERMNLSLMHASYFGDISYQFGGFAAQLPNKNVLGLGIQYLSPGSIDKVDKTGHPTGGALNPHDLAVTAAYARRFEGAGLDLGVAGKYISSRIDKAAHTAAMDAGARLRLTGRLTLAGSLSNFGKGMKYNLRTDPLPTTVRLGAGLRLPSEVLLSADLIAPKSAAAHLGAGAEYAVYSMVNPETAESIRFLLRGGYNGRNSPSKLSGAAGWSAGAGFEFSTWAVDYAWSSFGDLGNTHRISLGKQFGDAEYLETRANTRVREIQRVKAKGPKLISFPPGSPAFVAKNRAKLHSAPGSETRVIAELRRNEEVEVVIQRGDWVEVNTASGKKGWLHKSLLRKGR